MYGMGLAAAVNDLANLPTNAQNAFYGAYNNGLQAAGQSAAAAQYGARALAPQLYGDLQNQDIAYNQDQRAQAKLPFELNQMNAQTANLGANAADTQMNTLKTGTGIDTGAKQQFAGAVYTNMRNGMDANTAFNAALKAFPMTGLDAQTTQALRAELVANPQAIGGLLAGSFAGTSAGGAKGASSAQNAQNAKAEAIAQATANNAAVSTGTILTAANRALTASNDRSLPAFTSGIASYLPSSPSAEVYRQMQVLKANSSIEALNAMRQQSKTGGALGNVTEGEHKLLQAKAGALDPTSPTFNRDLADYTRTLLETVNGPEAGTKIFNEQYGAANTQNAPAPSAPALYTGFIDPHTGAVFQGGNPNDPNAWKKP